MVLFVGIIHVIKMNEQMDCLCAFGRYEYLRREGNFERSAGLQVGVDSVKVRVIKKARLPRGMFLLSKMSTNL